jgi:hypothetical protein
MPKATLFGPFFTVFDRIGWNFLGRGSKINKRTNRKLIDKVGCTESFVSVDDNSHLHPCSKEFRLQH